MIVIGQWSCALGVYAGSFRHDDYAWRAPLFTQVIPPVFLFCIALPLLPESPSWLILRGRREQAAKALRTFNGQDFDTDKAIAQIELAIQEEYRVLEQKSSYIDCFKPPNLRRTGIICMVYIAQQFIGINFIAGYLPYYFTLAGVHNPIGIAQVAYSIQLFGNICSWPLIDCFGRRPLIVGGTITMCATLLIIGGISTIKNSSALKATVALMTIWGYLVRLVILCRFTLVSSSQDNLVPSDLGPCRILGWR
jgi:MFS family permease